MDTLTIHHQDGDLVYRLKRGGYALDEGMFTVSVETAPVSEDQFPERALFVLADAPVTGELGKGASFHARSLMGETVEGSGISSAYFGSHAEDVSLRWTVHEVASDHVVFVLEAVHDDVDYYDERARPTRTTGVFTLSRRSRDDLWFPS